MEADGLLEDLEPEEVAKAVRRFKRDEPDLFGSAPTRQTRRRSRDDDDESDRDRDDDRHDRDDDRDDDRSSSRDRAKQTPGSRLRKGIESTNPSTDGRRRAGARS